METELEQKRRQLEQTISEFQRLLIAFSGGLDSTFLLKVSIEILGASNVLAVTAVSESMPAQELKEAVITADHLGARHRLILTDEFANPEYVKNSPMRCYFCKDELFVKMKKIAREENFPSIAYGAIADDAADFRPGMTAAKHHGIHEPLVAAGLVKSEIRKLSKGLPVSDKPASPCLSSRVPYGNGITADKLRQIEAGELMIKGLGFREVRVRHHGDIARIELPAADVARFLSEGTATLVSEKLKSLGFRYISLDLEGYRRGSLNMVLSRES